jgi:hypothetical protein
MSSPLDCEHSQRDGDVRSYVDDYLAGRGRDLVEHEQFAANHAQEIEEEFQRRAEELQQPIALVPSPQPEPEPGYESSLEHANDDAPPLVPDTDREYRDD